MNYKQTDYEKVSHKKVKNLFETTPDISQSNEFQRKFNGFYRIRRNKEWQDKFYKYFQNNKNNKELTLQESLEDILTLRGEC